MPRRKKEGGAPAFRSVDRMIGEAEREYMTGRPRQSWLRMEQAGEAPKRIKIGAQRVAWLESEILAWMRSRAAMRDAEQAEDAEPQAEEEDDEEEQQQPRPRRRRRQKPSVSDDDVEAEPCRRLPAE